MAGLDDQAEQFNITFNYYQKYATAVVSPIVYSVLVLPEARRIHLLVLVLSDFNNKNHQH